MPIWLTEYWAPDGWARVGIERAGADHQLLHRPRHRGTPGHHRRRRRRHCRGRSPNRRSVPVRATRSQHGPQLEREFLRPAPPRRERQAQLVGLPVGAGPIPLAVAARVAPPRETGGTLPAAGRCGFRQHLAKHPEVAIGLRRGGELPDPPAPGRRRRAARPARRRTTAVRRRWPTPAMSPGSTSRPSTLWRMTWAIPPTREPITGFAHAIPSMSVVPKDSASVSERHPDHARGPVMGDQLGPDEGSTR